MGIDTLAGTDGPAADGLITEAVRALYSSNSTGFQRSLRLLTVQPDAPGWELLVDRTLTMRLQAEVTDLWRRGWQPADLVRMASRRFSAAHARLVTDTVVAELAGYPAATIDDQWHDQLAGLDARVWWQGERHSERQGDHAGQWRVREGLDRELGIACALETLQMLMLLPTLESLGPVPGKARHRDAGPVKDVDKRLLVRVRALLAKAESTNFPAEAETFTAGAQALMARHSIDEAMVSAEAVGDPEGPGGRRIGTDAPYETAKATLVAVVATANRCRAVWNKELGFSTVVGFAGDLDAVELVHTSLLVQAMSALVKSGTRAHGDGKSRTRAFRSAFLTAYAHRIGERLSEAADSAVRQAAAEPGHASLLPVLAARDEIVEEAVGEMFGKTKRQRVGTRHDFEGWVSGRAAADAATLQGNRRIKP